MANLCEISGLALDADGSPVAGATINIEQTDAVATFPPASVVSGSDGSFSFFAPYDSKLKFSSTDVDEIDGVEITTPKTSAFTVGNFRAED